MWTGSDDDDNSDGCHALPKLNLQFLTMQDYLLRNLNLFRLESTYQIRQVLTLTSLTSLTSLISLTSLTSLHAQDIEDAIIRMKPFISEDGSTAFRGWFDWRLTE